MQTVVRVAKLPRVARNNLLTSSVGIAVLGLGGWGVRALGMTDSSVWTSSLLWWIGAVGLAGCVVWVCHAWAVGLGVLPVLVAWRKRGRWMIGPTCARLFGIGVSVGDASEVTLSAGAIENRKDRKGRPTAYRWRLRAGSDEISCTVYSPATDREREQLARW